MQDLHRPLSIILPAFLLLSAAGAFAQETAVEYSNRISITEDRLVAGFEEASLDGFHAESGLTLSMSDASPLNVRPTQGSSVLYVSPDTGIPADRWKTVSRSFETPEDFSSSPVAQFEIFTQQGPDRNQFCRMRLYSGKSYAEGTATIIPGLWRNVIFDFTGTKVVGKVDRIEISLM